MIQCQCPRGIPQTHVPLTQAQIEAQVDSCDSDPFPDDYMSGRIWPIAIVEPLSGSGRQDVTISHIAIMYLACAPFTNQGGANNNQCEDEQPSQSGIWGMFLEARPIEVPTGGISTNPLAPMHSLLIR